MFFFPLGHYNSNYLNSWKYLRPQRQLLANQTSEATSKKLQESSSRSLLPAIKWVGVKTLRLFFSCFHWLNYSFLLWNRDYDFILKATQSCIPTWPCKDRHQYPFIYCPFKQKKKPLLLLKLSQMEMLCLLLMLDTLYLCSCSLVKWDSNNVASR